MLRDILIYLDICDGNMEEGSFRCDANVSVRRKGDEKLGTRAELKNLNSFRSIERALAYEIERQAELVGRGGAVVQETRLFNVDEGVTYSMRGKEEAHDYRYFPEPDLVPLVVDEAWEEEIRKALPELPVEKMERFMSAYGLPRYDVEILTADRALAAYFEETVALFPEAKTVSNWIMSEFLRELNEAGVSAEHSRPAARRTRRAFDAHQGRRNIRQDRQRDLSRHLRKRRVAQGVHQGKGRSADHPTRTR